ncbi:MAG: right-handed parallel beta-helix repeat-containing protein [bacterium]
MIYAILFFLLVGVHTAVPATVFVAPRGDTRTGQGTAENPFGNLQEAMDYAADGDVLQLAPGQYVAVPAVFSESLCGNCLEHRTPVQATRGFLIEGKKLLIQGAGADKTILVTNAGYGVLFLNSRGSVIEDVAITGGVRDADGKATDAGIVAKFSTVEIRRCHIRDNTHYIDSIVVGIGGVMGRENSELWIHDCRLTNNSWDGVALYRGATALICDCVIDSGRGAGIGITWDASAVCLRNRISHYWKGLGSFGTSTVVARNNAVFDNLGWGIIATGASHLIAENNVVTRNGNCGMAIWSEESQGRIVNNIVTQNGWRKEWVCPCVGFWSVGRADDWIIGYNDVWGNIAGEFQGPLPQERMRGGLSTDPHFMDSLDFHLMLSSPCIDTGDSVLTDPDGSRCDMGLYGGPNARR